MSFWPTCLASTITLLFFLAYLPPSSAQSIGMCWGRIARQPVPPGVTVKQLQDNNITYVKLFSADREALAAMSGTGIEIMVMLTNNEVITVAQSMSEAQTWVNDNVQTWLPAGVNIKYVSVGNEPYLTNLQEVDQYLLDGVRNVYQALVTDGLDDKVKITVSFNSEILSNTYPVANSVFNSTWSAELTEIAQLIYNTSSVFSVNIYPFYAWRDKTQNLSASYIFYDRVNSSSNDTYTNLFDASLDAALYALEDAGISSDVNLIVGEVGWPTDGDSFATVAYAQEFNQGVIQKMLSGTGTPKRPNWTIKGYLFSLFDEDAKSTLAGPFERKWGIYDNQGSPKYNLDITGGADANKVLAATPGIYLEAATYCVAKSGLDTANLTVLFNKLCNGANSSDYGDLADCTPITANFSTSGYVCGEGTQSDFTSYAVNQYYQASGHNSTNCDWNGLAETTGTDPSYGNCTFRRGLDISRIDAYTSSTNSFNGYVFLYISLLILLLTTFL